MPNPAPGFVARPDHRVDLLPERRRVKVVFGGVTVADSNTALRVEETGHEPVHYLPEKDVRLDLMHPTEHHTRCPFKGEASYWSIDIDGQTHDGVAWSYDAPIPAAGEITGLLSFYPERVQVTVDGQPLGA